MNNLVDKLAALKAGEELIEALEIIPEYDSNICNESAAIRLMQLENIYSIYFPSYMSCEIYNKLYMAIMRSLTKKDSKLAIQQGYENYNQKVTKSGNGLIGGSDSFTIIGMSGIGKSASIQRAIDVITENNVILQDIYYYDEMTNKYMATGWVPTFWDLFMKKSNYTLADAAEMFTEGEI